MKGCLKSMLSLCVCAVYISACNSNWESELQKIERTRLYNNSYEGWTLDQKIEYDKYNTDYTISKVDKDTTKVLSFIVTSDNGPIYVNEYKKIFPCGLDRCYLVLQFMDTLYFYKENMQNEKIFMNGEYYYLYSNMKLNASQMDFFTENVDSLRKVKGNNLPALPSLSKAANRSIR